MPDRSRETDQPPRHSIHAPEIESGPRRISIVIGARDAEPQLIRCLESLGNVRGVEHAQIVVAAYPPWNANDRARFPEVEFIPVDSPCHLAALRAGGLAQAAHDWIYLTEPYCTFPPELLERLLASAQGAADIVGGSVAVGVDASIAAYASALMEYGQFFEPLPESFTEEITSNNVLYRRDLLEPMDQWAANGFWKYYAHRTFQAQGRAFAVDPGRRVIHHPPYRFVEFVVRTFHHARTFGAMRMEGASTSAKAVAALRSPLIPALFTLRLLKRMWPKPKYRMRTVTALPVLWCYYVAWAVGEALGSIAGAGDSAGRVY